MTGDERLDRIDDSLNAIKERLAGIESELRHTATKADVQGAKNYTLLSIGSAVVSVGCAALVAMRLLGG